MDIIEIKYTDKAYPKRLLQIEKFPKTLYATGDISLLNREHILGMVGSRKCSEYGIDAASHIGAIDEIR